MAIPNKNSGQVFRVSALWLSNGFLGSYSNKDYKQIFRFVGVDKIGSIFAI